ncbi:hypothetical protein FOL47_008079 [Perkinsus chesapeaki]|uniref:UDP-glucose glycoprotein glucosyltransferase n=1 Tax=Perkinsus chesapeaki TaxID=330153 RepID=A0A7J6MVN6_PERCH|nr:hypothetical protein FOL47_008079 [Perkinsus chesapeaki]
MRLDYLCIVCLIGADVLNSHTVKVSLESSWPMVKEESQTVEFLSHLGGDQAREYLTTNITAEKLLKSQNAKSLLKVMVENRCFSPMVEYYRSFDRFARRECDRDTPVVVEVDGNGLKSGCLAEDICVVERSQNASSKEFEGIEIQRGGSDEDSVTTAVVYGEARSLSSVAVLKSLTENCCESCRVLFRHGDGGGNVAAKPREAIAGYGVGLTIKNSEYKASADSESDKTELEEQSDGGCGEAGVCWGRLQERYPDVDFSKAKVNLKMEKLLSPADRKLKAWELTSVGAQFLEAASGNISEAIEILRNFPGRVVELSEATVSSAAKEQVAELAKVPQAGAYLLSSGEPMDENMIKLHPIMEKLMPIYLAVEELVVLGMSEAAAAEMVRGATRVASAGRLEWRPVEEEDGVGPAYVYNVLKDPQTSRWGDDLDIIIQMLMMGHRGIAPLKRVIFDIIFLIDLSDRSQVLETVGRLMTQPFPARIALVPDTRTPEGARAAECFGEVYGSGRKKDMKKVRQFLAGLVRAANGDEEDVMTIESIEKICEDVLLEELPESGEDVPEIVRRGQAWAATKGLPFPSVVVNGLVSENLADTAVFIGEDFQALAAAWYTRHVEKQKDENMDSEDEEINDVIREIIFPEKSVKYLSSVYHPALFTDETDEKSTVQLPMRILGRVTHLMAAGTVETPLHVMVVVGGGKENVESKIEVVKKIGKFLEGRPGAIMTVLGADDATNSRLQGCVDSFDALRNFEMSKCGKIPSDDAMKAARELIHAAGVSDAAEVTMIVNGKKLELDVAKVEPILEEFVEALFGSYKAEQGNCGSLGPLACAVANSFVQSIAAVENPHREVMEEGLQKSFKNTPLAAFNLVARGNLVLEMVASIDPLTDSGRSALMVIKYLNDVLDGFGARMVLTPQDKYSEYPLKSWHRSVTAGGAAEFILEPSRNTLTLGMDVLPNWQVSSRKGRVDMDNIRITPADEEIVEAQYVLKQLYVEGQSYDVDANGHPRGPADGAQLQLLDLTSKPLAETWVIRNLGYYQLFANPGRYSIQLKPDTMGREVYEAMGTNVVDVNKFMMPSYPVKLRLKPEMSREMIYDQQDDNLDDDGPIHIFTVASGHLYEQLLAVMILSVRNHTTSKLCFWFVDQFLSPQFREFIPQLAEEYNFEYRFVTYKWPTWLNPQSEKQRLIWAYKILFLDVLFPPSVNRIIFIDADQVVRADVRELWDMDLQGKVYGFTPMGDTNPSTEGFRFWKQGYWLNHLAGRPYHISALFVVDLARFRKTGAGDSLRAVYNQLSQDPNSLANLDQDLPNYAQHQIHIYSLPADWLWCETWCGEEAKATAKTIDLCQNPLTKEPKTEMARRIIPEWSDYWGEVQKLIAKVQAARLEEKL